MSLLYVAIAGVVLVVLYKMMVASNAKHLDAGKEFISGSVDIFDFMCRPVSSLSPTEMAGFNYLIMKPWKETRSHFAPLLRGYEGRAALSTPEEREFMEGTSADMGISETFAMAAKVLPLPESVKDLAPYAYGKWTDEHKKTLDNYPNHSVGFYIGISSTAAADAIMTSHMKAFGKG